MSSKCMHRTRTEHLLSSFSVIADNPGITRSALAEMTSLSLMTAGKIADILCRLGAVTQTAASASRAGRHSQCLRVSGNRYAVILNLTSRNFDAVFMDLNLSEILRHTHPYSEDFYFEENWQMFLSEVLLLTKRMENMGECIGIAACVPGTYDPDTDRTNSPCFPAWNRLSVRGYIAQVFAHRNIIVQAASHAGAAAVLPSVSDAQNKTVLYCRIDKHALSGAVVHGGAVRSGAHGTAGDLGAMAVQGGQTLSSAIAQHTLPAEWAADTAHALYNAICLLDPDCIAIDSTLPGDSAHLVHMIREILTDRFRLPAGREPQWITVPDGQCPPDRGLCMALREAWLRQRIETEWSV